ncbi:hypothetical protein NNO07_11070 [Pseudomonas resinovorans]|uniref:Uncharacterized protein n=1 Tax=Metapseudomonas resinovorans TaxID=53412 RepID=A0ABT4Y452_METRE|nr:hypothetical protein [Pseudomonas resinovorans]MDA8483614.1 hypothetical protein [Pseudomonas resinovorans]
MSKRVRTDKVRKQDAVRQQRKRALDAARNARLGGEKLKLMTFQGTRDGLAVMRQVGGYRNDDEVVSLAVRYLAGLARRDPAAFLEAMDPRNPV